MGRDRAAARRRERAGYTYTYVRVRGAVDVLEREVTGIYTRDSREEKGDRTTERQAATARHRALINFRQCQIAERTWWPRFLTHLSAFRARLAASLESTVSYR